MFGLPMQDLFDQVVDDVAVVPREARDEAGDIVAPLHRERRQLESGDPAFGAPLQRGDVPRSEIQPHHLVEVGGGLVRREAQIGGADLDELAPRPQAGQRQRRIGAGGDHQVDLWGQVLQQERHPVLDVVRVDHVVVVEHQHDVVRHRAELVEQRGEDRLDRRWLGPLQQGQRPCADPRRHRLQRGHQVGPERRGLVVAWVERKPRRGPFIGRSGCQPLGQQRRLAEAGRGGDERQLRLGPTAHALDEPWACDQAASQPGDVELGLEQRACVVQRCHFLCCMAAVRGCAICRCDACSHALWASSGPSR